MDVKDLRDSLSQLLASYIGSYTLLDGTVIPAVYVEGQGGVPQGWKVEGLEVVIQEFPNVNPRAILAGGFDRKTWTVVLTDYLPESTALKEAMTLVKRRYPDSSFSFRPEMDTVYGQCRITIRDYEVFRLA